MGIKSIHISNVLSFDDLRLDDIKDINCIIGQNNVGKTNLSKVINYFYSKLKNENILPLELNSRYSPTGKISIAYDVTRLKSVLSASKNNSKYQKFAYKSIFKRDIFQEEDMVRRLKKTSKGRYQYILTLTLDRNGAVSWSEKDENAREVISRIYPFYAIDTRRLDLYDWSKIWNSISQLKFLNMSQLTKDEHVDYIDAKVSSKSNSYKDYVTKINNITKTAPYGYHEKILNYIKVGLDGHTFNINGNELTSQSDGTNSHRYLELFLHLMIALTRREFITPTIYIDEPEIGLHPKRNEELIYNLFRVYSSFKKNKDTFELGKYATPYPKMIFSTHSPNIVKMIIKLFTGENEHQILHFSKKENTGTMATVMHSYFEDPRFTNIFSDNEARLFFSKFILFVEGETEVEIFGNLKLQEKFTKLSKIDVYRANEVLLAGINPQFSNLSIPYLILYDADKMISIEPDNGLIIFKKAEVNLFEIKDKYSRTFFNEKNAKIYEEVNEILTKNHEKTKALLPSKIGFKEFNYSGFIKRINRLTVDTHRKFIAETTIEGALINEHSIDIFLKWIAYEFMHNLPLGGKGSLCKRYQNLKAAYLRDGKLSKLFCGLFGFPKEKDLIDKEICRDAKKIKIKYLKSMKSEIYNLNLSRDELVTILRLVFEGKTSTLVSCSNNHYTKISPDIKAHVKNFKEVYLKQFPCQTTKTGGWVSKFIDFSIRQIEIDEKSTKETFSYHFNRVFPEIYGIIRAVSVSID